ncbi:response regulator [Acinetobacter sp. YH16044]|uniref:response regulator n=1 Tax=Acinetobacter sp. YH16044 TaxID=2601187 RepID=UPI0015D2E157|nr:response regulator [Acinetobacter sp. YH16044]
MFGFFKRNVKIQKKFDISDLRVGSIETIDRNKFKILCIDDQGFQYEHLLKNHDFNLKVVSDIEDINAVEAYDLIVCDIIGVGKAFGSKFEGGHIISEIKKRYPFKKVIAFSGSQFNPEFNKYFTLSDKSLNKDTELETWVDVLDTLIQDLAYPERVWQSTKTYLNNNNLDAFTIDFFHKSFFTQLQVINSSN